MEHKVLIGEGSTAQVVIFSPTEVAKIFHDHISDDFVEHEYSIHKNILQSGLLVPEVRWGKPIPGKRVLIYEKVEGITLTKLLESQPQKALYYLKKMATLQNSVHEKKLPTLPSQFEVLKQKIMSVKELNGDDKKRIIKGLEALPLGQCMCHGDFHPDNILITKDNAVIIDWCDATSGNRMADLARTLLILRYGGLQDRTSFLNFRTTLYARKLLAMYYRKSYTRHYQFSSRVLESWMVPIAAARLSENLPDFEKKLLLSIINKGLIGN
ncbi:phosphotransferase family protein [Fictibacillus norfolkensis]|uniref:Aminoglycoside phosphotransferase family protein n=1 Tax=Fictibacillus norfolkensis TaxID=2762233 RepID=A0ABR8SJE8_9BACL|nr:aminoglycoside phosphotransferase family protein [Fictibacillus norfolkensis]MBD7963610.1 aminoglycoside phosphotransferase family protein [Fictibacillus norfolkensis]